MHLHLTIPPALIIISSGLISIGASLTRDALIRLFAYIGADYVLIKLGKRGSITYHRSALDHFLDD